MAPVNGIIQAINHANSLYLGMQSLYEVMKKFYYQVFLSEINEVRCIFQASCKVGA